MNVIADIKNALGLPNNGEAETQSVYFIGIGGIGMSALARYFKAKGVKVSGYDRTATKLTRQLEAEGIDVHYTDDISLADKDAALVVFTPAVPKEHRELNYFIDNAYPLLKRSDVLGAITNSSFNICVAGTHGKTTTSTMVAHILRHSGYGCNAFLGGISANYGANFWASEKNVCVVEADEYDRSFLKLSPDVAIITAMDPDHLDIYGTAENVEQAFLDFSGKIKTGGKLFLKHGLKRSGDFRVADTVTYSTADDKAGIHMKNLVIENGAYRFDVVAKDWSLGSVELNMGGLHNIENLLAAIGVAMHLSIDAEKIKAAVKAFRGVKRRFEYIVKNESVVYIDDYAHHPDELKALLMGAKNLYPGKKCTIVFQPHLYSRTRDFAEGFASVLGLADEVVLLPIYPARELPVEGVTSEMLLGLMTNKNSRVVEKKELVNRLNEQELEVLITAGAGDIDTLVEPIREMLEQKFK